MGAPATLPEGTNCQRRDWKTLLFAQKARQSFPIDAQRLGGAGLVAGLLLQDALGIPARQLVQRRMVGGQRIRERRLRRKWRRDDGGGRPLRRTAARLPALPD